jgi:hypothetical protein
VFATVRPVSGSGSPPVTSVRGPSDGAQRHLEGAVTESRSVRSGRALGDLLGAPLPTCGPPNASDPVTFVTTKEEEVILGGAETRRTRVRVGSSAADGVGDGVDSAPSPSSSAVRRACMDRPHAGR